MFIPVWLPKIDQEFPKIDFSIRHHAAVDDQSCMRLLHRRSEGHAFPPLGPPAFARPAGVVSGRSPQL